jgi:hypothetical protein
MTASLVGLLLALSVGLLGTAAGLDRDRAYYPVIAIVVASYYALFAVMGGSTPALVRESLAGMLFAVAAVVGFRRSLWITAGALAAHGLFDSVHADLLANAGVPPWWPAFCLAFDVAAAGYLAWLLWTGRVRAQAA